MLRVGQRGWDRGLLGVLLLALSGCTAILDFSEPIGKRDGGPAQDAGDAAPTSPDASPAVCSSFEPNNTLADSKAITPMDVASAICTVTDTDIFAFSVIDAQEVSITLSFTPAAGDDLDLQLLDPLGDLIVESTGTGNTEQIIRGGATGLVAGTYYIAVQPVSVTAVVSYSINLTIAPAP